MEIFLGIAALFWAIASFEMLEKKRCDDAAASIYRLLGEPSIAEARDQVTSFRLNTGTPSNSAELARIRALYFKILWTFSAVYLARRGIAGSLFGIRRVYRLNRRAVKQLDAFIWPLVAEYSEGHRELLQTLGLELKDAEPSSLGLALLYDLLTRAECSSLKMRRKTYGRQRPGW